MFFEISDAGELLFLQATLIKLVDLAVDQVIFVYYD